VKCERCVSYLQGLHPTDVIILDRIVCTAYHLLQWWTKLWLLSIWQFFLISTWKCQANQVWVCTQWNHKQTLQIKLGKGKTAEKKLCCCRKCLYCSVVDMKKKEILGTCCNSLSEQGEGKTTTVSNKKWLDLKSVARKPPKEPKMSRWMLTTPMRTGLLRVIWEHWDHYWKDSTLRCFISRAFGHRPRLHVSIFIS